MRSIYHALVLNFHQPPGNLDELLDTTPWETQEILQAMDRMPRSLWDYEDVARVHLSLSGSLLETLSSPGFQERVYGVVDVGSLLWHLQNRKLFSILGTGYYHPVLPLIPEADWEEQLTRWRSIAGHLLWRDDFQGFWPPEMGFSMELIPLLKRLGYRYVLVDSDHVEAVTPMRWEELHYRPHIARHGDDEIIVVVRDRSLSDAQESGMELGWFLNELEARTRWCDFPPLVTTATDGDNGGWFRNPQPQANFWGMYQGLLEQARSGGVQPTFIEDYLDEFGAHGEVRVNTGAWNTGWHHGHGFVQWTGSQAQKDALERVAQISRTLQQHRTQIGPTADSPQVTELTEQARWRLLRAQTSCNFYWGEAWLGRAHADLDVSAELLQQLSQLIESP